MRDKKTFIYFGFLLAISLLVWRQSAFAQASQVQTLYRYHGFVAEFVNHHNWDIWQHEDDSLGINPFICNDRNNERELYYELEKTSSGEVIEKHKRLCMVTWPYFFFDTRPGADDIYIRVIVPFVHTGRDSCPTGILLGELGYSEQAFTGNTTQEFRASTKKTDWTNNTQNIHHRCMSEPEFLANYQVIPLPEHLREQVPLAKKANIHN